MEKSHSAQSPAPKAKVAADARELALSQIQTALLQQQSSLEQIGGFDPYNCRQGSSRSEVWDSRRR